MLSLRGARALQSTCHSIWTTRGMCELIKLPTQRLPTKRTIAELEHGIDEDVDNRPSPVADIEARIEASKAKLRWRKPHTENTAVWFSKLRAFAPERLNVDRMLRFHQNSYSPDKYLAYRRQIQLAYESFLQSFIIERHKILGNDLATAHFLVYRGGKVKFTKSDDWVKRNEWQEYDLPSKYDPAWVVEELDCAGMTIYYEGFENIRRLTHLKKFSLQNVKTLDDWALDRLAGNDFIRLEELNLSGTNVTTGGLVALFKIPSLRLLIVDAPKRSVEFELTLLAMQDTMPNLVVRDSVTGEEF